MTRKTVKKKPSRSAPRKDDFAQTMQAIHRAQAVIEFNVDGTVRDANENFCKTLGYRREELVGKHHRMFCEPVYAASPEYTELWAKLRAGEFVGGVFRRVGRNNTTVWIQATYTPILAANGTVSKVIKFATDITATYSQTQARIAQMSATVEGAMTPMMTIDRGLTVTYANKATRALLKKHEVTLQKLYPSFRVDSLVGTCIDLFHQDPAHQRRILGDPRNLPYSADIQVAHLTFRINVNGIFDGTGEYTGNSLEWADVTDERRHQREVAQLQSAVAGLDTKLMMADADGRITYANPSVVSLLARRTVELRKVFPSFDSDKLIGQEIHQFHKNSAHQRRLLGDTKNLPYRAEISVAGLEFGLNATAIVDDKGNLTGNAVEWTDITEQKDAERQIQSLVTAASQGQLDQRIDPSRFSGFLKNLANGINQLLEAVVAPTREAILTVEAMAQGQITTRMSGQYSGEFAKLQSALNESLDKLSGTVVRIVSAAKAVTSASGDIAEGNTNLSARTQEQASALEETASSVEEMTATVKQNAASAVKANELASAARVAAEKGGQVVAESVSAMQGIADSARKVGDIIGVIEQIAFQTNMLALNAAVEAARAGDQGRGFAVVAAEVRNLAQRSAAAAKEIKTLIQNSGEKVTQGTVLVNQSGESLKEIVAGVKKVSEIIANISSASSEQSSGIDQINVAVMQMDKNTQQNAALVEEAAAAAASMKDQARAMLDVVSFFDVAKVEVGAEVLEPALVPAAMVPSVTKRKGAEPKDIEKVLGPAATPSADGEWVDF